MRLSQSSHSGPAHQQRHDGADQEQHKQDFGDPGRAGCDPAEAEYCGNDRDNEEEQCVVKHDVLGIPGARRSGPEPLVWMSRLAGIVRASAPHVGQGGAACPVGAGLHSSGRAHGGCLPLIELFPWCTSRSPHICKSPRSVSVRRSHGNCTTMSAACSLHRSWYSTSSFVSFPKGRTKSGTDCATSSARWIRAWRSSGGWSRSCVQVSWTISGSMPRCNGWQTSNAGARGSAVSSWSRPPSRI